MKKKLGDKIVLITGASSGIGRGVARTLCHDGYNLILTSRSTEKLNQLKNELSDFSEKIHLIACDLTNSHDVENLYKKTLEIGFVEYIISNAGLGRFSSIDQMSVEDWDVQINTNLRPSFLLTRLFVSKMKKNKTGHLVFINSVAGKYGHSFSNSTAYVSSKYALKGFADSLRTELRDYNVKVSSVYPGAIDTEFWDSINVDFPRNEMLSIDDLSETILHVIKAPNSSVIEDVVVRRTAGDF
mgnify:CR=1 FL=1